MENLFIFSCTKLGLLHTFRHAPPSMSVFGDSNVADGGGADKRYETNSGCGGRVIFLVESDRVVRPIEGLHGFDLREGRIDPS